MIIKKKILFIIFIICLITIEIFLYKYPLKKNNNKNIKYLYTQHTHIKLSKSELFIINHKNIYGILTSMKLIKIYIQKKQFEKSIICLNYALKFTQEKNLRIILQVRLARVHIEKQQYLKSIKLLNYIKNITWKKLSKKITSDIFRKQKNMNQALKNWNNINVIKVSSIYKL
ncbi:UPF0070 protein YfgM [Buchnera aphidicola (Phyllaphis fagi)]|uniref:tetratricopeptide repeat protein n=1 Tax=Buchnera aphidicola TaxID=9 RepID=UPI003464C27C